LKSKLRTPPQQNLQRKPLAKLCPFPLRLRPLPRRCPPKKPLASPCPLRLPLKLRLRLLPRRCPPRSPSKARLIRTFHHLSTLLPESRVDFLIHQQRHHSIFTRQRYRKQL
jgi:hypothetical protein